MTPAEVATKLRAFNEWRRGGDIEYPGPLAVDEAIDAAVEMTDRLEAAEKSDAESLAMYRKARDERDALRAALQHETDCLEAAKAEIEALRAKIEQMERQDCSKQSMPAEVPREFVMDAIAQALGDAYDCMRVWSAWGYGTMSQDDFQLIAEDGDRLREIADAAIMAMGASAPKPCAQPAPSVPDGWKLVPIEPTQEMLDAGEDTFVSSLSGTPTSSPIAVYRAMLAAAPEAKL